MSDEKESSLRARQNQDFSQDLAKKGWFHSFRLPDGTFYDGHLSVEELQRRVSFMPIPADLSGQRVLDIGAWDGWFSFEMEHRGAHVVAIDCVEVKNFRKIHAALGSGVEYRVADIHDVTIESWGRFNIVLFLSVLYHLKHPLLALEKVCALATDLAIVSSFTMDDYRRALPDLLSDLPRLDFYETDELGGQLDNWFGPNLACLMALCRAAGFARVDLLDISGQSATVACYRKWLPPAPHAPAGPRLLSAINARSSGINFRTAASEEHVACWFESEAMPIARESLKPEVGGYGVPCLHLSKQAGNAWQCNFRLPPGLTPGWHAVALRLGDSASSDCLRIAVDVPFVVGELAIHSACDAFSWQPSAIVRSADGRAGVSIWVRGLPENADRNNVKAFLGSVELVVDAVTPSNGATMQLNAMLPEMPPLGSHSLAVSAGGVRSAPIMMEIVA
jgi:tRNA (mo5U34)-methyltransferase